MMDLGSDKKSALAVNQRSVFEENSHNMFSHSDLDKEWLLLNVSQSEETLIVKWNNFHMFWGLHKHTGPGQVW